MNDGAENGKRKTVDVVGIILVITCGATVLDCLSFGLFMLVSWLFLPLAGAMIAGRRPLLYGLLTSTLHLACYVFFFFLPNPNIIYVGGRFAHAVITGEFKVYGWMFAIMTPIAIITCLPLEIIWRKRDRQ